MLEILPAEGEMGWEKLTEWEQTFLDSVREQFEDEKILSEKQLEVLERIWDKDV
jgi:hypothetical protein